jgi:transcriptional regulator with XRE-family HTH domain
MFKNTGKLTPLNWPDLVAQTLYMRKRLALTQKEHAALAGVSIPTMISFERVETSISIEKVIAILNVVGMVTNKEFSKNNLDSFISNAENRWLSLIQNLPANSQVRNPHGYYTYTYEIIGGMVLENTDELLEKMKKAADVKYSGWSPFYIFTRKEIAPYLQEDCIECWLKDSDFGRADTTDFWRASLDGHLHLHRGYWEDTDTAEPGKKLEIDFHILRAGEFILHIARLARLICSNPDNVRIKLKAIYTGLEGRELTSLDGMLYERRTCHQNTVELATEFNLSDISENLEQKDKLAHIVHQLLTELYSRFDFFKISEELVASRLNRMRAHRF